MITNGRVPHQPRVISWVAYTLANDGDRIVRGQAFADANGDPFYEEVRVVLLARGPLAAFRMKNCGDHTGLG
jgi:hypothetical protein